MGLIKKIFGTSSEREIKKVKHLVQKILDYEPSYAQLSEFELQNKTTEFRQRFAQGESLDDLLPEAFATVREAAWRVLGMKHFPVQLIGGIILFQGRIAEMKTGEGKTLVATLPVYLSALAGVGVHVVTVNDYLAKRDSEWMGKIYRYLGLSVGLIVNGLNNTERRKAYCSDITYGTNNEFGFDYLRDNMVVSLEDRVQRDLHFAIVDEVDSILIDEARTPLIISGSGDKSSDLYQQAQRFVASLHSRTFKETDSKLDFAESEELQGDADYIIDEKAKTAVLTKKGIEKAERFFKLDNLAEQSNYQLNHHINNALRANGIMHRDEDYVLSDGEVIIVDDFTGRLMEGRRYSNGLHQAIEAKERVEIRCESKTLATITFQNYFRMYKKLAGMTGTAMTEEDEFRQIYKLDVVEIPTNMPMLRDDQADAVFKTQRGKYKRLIEEVKEVHETGQPLLIGTISVERSEFLSALFTKAGIPHNVLNAKQHDREAEIVAQAGRLGAVTLSTNMAGRGTDIMLGGNAEHLAKQEMKKRGIHEDLIEQADAYNEVDDDLLRDARRLFRQLKADFQAEIEIEKEKVIAVGGLYIMGTERHESRRIDNQLRGRSGRQGDKGKSKFFLSLEDDLMRIFGGERMERIFSSLGMDEEMEINHSLLNKGIESAQKRVEAQNFSIRKHVLNYDDVMNQQRELIYKQRQEVLQGKDVHEYFRKTATDLCRQTMLDYCAEEADSAKWDKDSICARLEDLFGELEPMQELRQKDKFLDAAELTEQLCTAVEAKLADRQSVFGGEAEYRAAERLVLLQMVDNHWMDHIDGMDALRDSIGMRAYAQHDPVIEYKKEGYEMFAGMTTAIQEDSVRLLMRASFISEEQTKQRSQAELVEGKKEARSAYQQASRAGESQRQQAAAAGGKTAPAKRQISVGRNDPCWCGSGKKYKNCHWAQDQNS